MKTTEDNNKLIAEFMGMEKERHLDGRYLFTTDLEELRGSDTRFTEELYFHISWDWLMPVLKKINLQIHPETTGLWRKVTCPIEYDIHEVHQAVVEFINEYNKNKS
tara:strand:- start:169 stop:486 length:318 start_codon:yes stop_codon:yes gene_type:complete